MATVGQSNLPIAPTQLQIMQQCSFQVGIIRDVKDPEGKGRVKVEVPALWGNTGGKDCWSGWMPRMGLPIGAGYKEGDHGIWWPPVPGEKVLVGFIGGGVYGAFCITGLVCQNSEGKENVLLPSEVKKLTKEDVRKGTKLSVIKSESGATFLADDNGKQEAMFLCDWTGAGLFLDAPGKTPDAQESQGDPSVARNGECRKGRTVAAQTSPGPGVCEGGMAMLGLLDLLGQGMVTVARDGAGVVTIFATESPGESEVSIILDAKKKRIIFTADKTQMVIDGKKGHIATTKTIIQEQIFTPMKDFISACLGRLQSTFKRYSD